MNYVTVKRFCRHILFLGVALIFMNCVSTCDRRTVPVTKLTRPVSLTQTFEINGNIVNVESFAVKKQEFIVTHKYWSIINGLWTLGQNDVIIEKLEAAVSEANGDYVAGLEIIMQPCWPNYLPTAYFLLQPTCLNLTMRGDIYQKK